ncbi:hypothetical protein LOK49_LG02G01352 [Camellia lanceoleosa]|uniref:Uncharacterized protein n=1 Tax=Camellia lanceoleosa TaxID=1840588 RepID=A0ACC0IQS8_9ERIC|nr:hypothetical protein LOK49_LG02G01352 [Camellia lanceoleosa]
MIAHGINVGDVKKLQDAGIYTCNGLMMHTKKLEEGQVKMQSRLEEEEEAKAALMSRIQRLTKLILVSTKNAIPACLNDVPNHQ